MKIVLTAPPDYSTSHAITHADFKSDLPAEVIKTLCGITISGKWHVLTAQFGHTHSKLACPTCIAKSTEERRDHHPEFVKRALHVVRKVKTVPVLYAASDGWMTDHHLDLSDEEIYRLFLQQDLDTERFWNFQ